MTETKYLDKNKKLKILFISAYFPPEMVSSTYLTTNLIDSMIKKGFIVTVLAPTPSRGLTKNDSTKSYKPYEISLLSNYKLTRIRLFREPKSNFMRFVRYIFFGIAVLLKSIFIKYDIIFTFSTPPSIGFFCTISAKIKKKKFVYCVQDLFPESLKILGIKEKSFVYKLGEFIEGIAFKNTDSLITISEEIKDLILKKKIGLSNIQVIENWIDSEKIYPIIRSNNPLYSKYSIRSNDFNIIYSGNIGQSQNFEMIIEVAEQIKHTNSIKFIFFGNGSFKQKLIDLKNTKNLSNVMVFDPEPEDNIKFIYGMASMSLVTSKAGVSKYSLPNKTFNIMACKIPLLVSFDKDSKLWKLINKTNSGFCVEPNDINGMKNLILEIYRNNTKLIGLGENGYNYVKKYLDKKVKVDEYLKLFRIN